MAIWCLKNPERCSEPKVRQLVDAVGQSDMHAGAYVLNGMAKAVEWVSAPQTDSVRNGDYAKLSDNGLLTIMESIIHRIDKYVDGDAAVDDLVSAVLVDVAHADSVIAAAVRPGPLPDSRQGAVAEVPRFCPHQRVRAAKHHHAWSLAIQIGDANEISIDPIPVGIAPVRDVASGNPVGSGADRAGRAVEHGEVFRTRFDSAGRATIVRDAVLIQIFVGPLGPLGDHFGSSVPIQVEDGEG